MMCQQWLGKQMPQCLSLERLAGQKLSQNFPDALDGQEYAEDLIHFRPVLGRTQTHAGHVGLHQSVTL